MKHLCKNCIYCEKILKAKGKYINYCEKESCEKPGRVKHCNYHEKKYLSIEDLLNMYDISIITVAKKENNNETIN